jgi:hypothetical protein
MAVKKVVALYRCAGASKGLILLWITLHILTSSQCHLRMRGSLSIGVTGTVTSCGTLSLPSSDVGEMRIRVIDEHCSLHKRGSTVVHQARLAEVYIMEHTGSRFFGLVRSGFRISGIQGYLDSYPLS